MTIKKLITLWIERKSEMKAPSYSKIYCLILSFESDIGTGKSMEVYYKNLIKSKRINPVMVYTSEFSYKNAPDWIRNKVGFFIKNTDHDPADCNKFCKLNPSEHRTYDIWIQECIPYLHLLRRMFGEKSLWVMDTTMPDMERHMGRFTVQAFHGELFDEGKSYFQTEASIKSFKNYWVMFPHGRWLRNKIIERCGLKTQDKRIKMIGRVLNDSIYSGELRKFEILKSFKLNPKNKTILYAPTYKSKKIWAIGSEGEDLQNLENFCKFLQSRKLNAIFRPHPISIHHYYLKRQYLKVLKKFKNTHFDETSNVDFYGPNKSIIAADVLVTDISTIATDFMSLNKPAVMIYPNYRGGVWGNKPKFSELSAVGYAVRDFKELYATIEKLTFQKESPKMVVKRMNFVKKSLQYNDGSSGDRFRKFLESNVKKISVLSFLKFFYIKSLIKHIIYKPKANDLKYPLHIKLDNL